MASESQLRLKTAAEQIAAAAREARGWVKEVRADAPSVGSAADSLIDAARRTENLSRKASRSATRRMCIGIFGESQTGKSYLLPVLARPSGHSELFARFGGEKRDFIREINPKGGGKESTGLVTRLTTAQEDQPKDPNLPVALRLLSETDIVKILGNSFFSDFDLNKIEFKVLKREEIQQRIFAAEQSREEQPLAPYLDEIELFDIGEYFHKNFSARWQELNLHRYWDKIIELASRLPLRERAELFGVLWGGLGEFTNLYYLLAGALDQLGHATEAVTEMRSLIPRETSIIDVATLYRLGTPTDDGGRLSVRPLSDGGKLGAAVDVPRGVLTALVAELRIALDEAPHAMFKDIDLLDFPGARSRLTLSNLDADPEKNSRQVRDLLLRGKIAYLFERYAEERDVAAMLLCMSNTQSEVRDLGAMVWRWIEITHGTTPEARARVPTSLFLILTKMDLEFVQKTGETDDAIATKWDTRLEISLAAPYRYTGWPDNFAGAPFNNVFLLRNPEIRQDHLVEYKLRVGADEPVQPLVEIGLSRPNRKYIEQVQRAFLNSAKVAQHFQDPGRAWSEMFKWNDGGVSYLIEKLAAVCVPALKDMQVEHRLREGAGSLLASLERFYHGRDEDARRKREAALKDLRIRLQQAFQAEKFRPFPRLVSNLMLRERDIREIVLNSRDLSSKTSPAAAPEVDDIFASPQRADEPNTAPRPNRDDRPARIAGELHRHWIDGLYRLPQEGELLRHFKVDAGALSELVEQLKIASDRLKLVDRVAERIRAAMPLAGDNADRVAIVASHSFNVFVSEVGFEDVAMAQRPGVPEGAATFVRRVFEPAPAVPDAGLPTLGEAPEELAQRAFVDWGIAFLQMGLANLAHGGGRELTDQQNAALGEILGKLSIDRALAASAAKTS
ncbi:MAG: virulence factor SrfC family protein [Alphaproteobacteria bacterium]